jgi:hypothetical protein
VKAVASARAEASAKASATAGPKKAGAARISNSFSLQGLRLRTWNQLSEIILPMAMLAMEIVILV